jgi:murein DD-endopeptidase MepM/ murein hydrolase activator NlpD
MDSQHLQLRLRALSRLAAIALVAAVPAAAIGAEPSADRVAAASGAPLVRLYDPLEQVAERAESRADRRSGPFHPVRGRVGYGDAEAAFGNARGRPHEGQDIFAAAGTPVVAPADGLAVDGGSDGGRGNWLAVYDPERRLTYSFFHLLAPVAVGVGEQVDAGETLGRVGCSGSCWGDHLHFEIRRGRGPYGAAIDPLPRLERWQQLRR